MRTTWFDRSNLTVHLCLDDIPFWIYAVEDEKDAQYLINIWESGEMQMPTTQSSDIGV
jgi:hypothetical protein